MNSALQAPIHDSSTIKKQLAELVLHHAIIRSSARLLPRGRPFRWSHDELGLISRGKIAVYSADGERKLVLEAGDVIGPWLGDLSELVLSAESTTCQLWAFSHYDLQFVLSGHLDRQLAWAQYTRLYAGWQKLGEQSPSQDDDGRLMFEPGAVIIRQGDFGSEVYTLVDGSADAFVDGLKVGSISPGEIFGAYGALSGQKRTATVRATSKATVLSLDRDDFLHALREQPEWVNRLVADMARTVKTVKQKVYALSATQR